MSRLTLGRGDLILVLLQNKPTVCAEPGAYMGALVARCGTSADALYNLRLVLVVHAGALQAAAILKAEVYGIARPDWASDQAAVAAAAGKVVVPEFKPKQGVKIETDPKVRTDSLLAVHSRGCNCELVNGRMWSCGKFFCKLSTCAAALHYIGQPTVVNWVCAARQGW